MQDVTGKSKSTNQKNVETSNVWKYPHFCFTLIVIQGSSALCMSETMFRHPPLIN